VTPVKILAAPAPVIVKLTHPVSTRKGERIVVSIAIAASVAGAALILWKLMPDLRSNIAGILIGIFVSKAISLITGWQSPISLAAVGVGFLFSAVVGIFFGFYPARMAANFDLATNKRILVPYSRG